MNTHLEVNVFTICSSRVSAISMASLQLVKGGYIISSIIGLSTWAYAVLTCINAWTVRHSQTQFWECDRSYSAKQIRRTKKEKWLLLATKFFIAPARMQTSLVGRTFESMSFFRSSVNRTFAATWKITETRSMMICLSSGRKSKPSMLTSP